MVCGSIKYQKLGPDMTISANASQLFFPPDSNATGLGGEVLVSHDKYLIEIACLEVWLCQDQTVRRQVEGGLQYKTAIEMDFTGSGNRTRIKF